MKKEYEKSKLVIEEEYRNIDEIEMI